MADIRGEGGGKGQMPLEYLYSAMQMEKYSGAAPPLHPRWFHLHYALSLLCLCLLFYRPSLRYLFSFFLLPLLALLPHLYPEFFLCSSLFLSFSIFFDSISACLHVSGS